MNKILFKLENFNVSYKNLPALKNISIEIRESEKVVLIGPSGGGKTTLLKSLFELNPKQSSFIHQDFDLVNYQMMEIGYLLYLWFYLVNL